MTNQRHYQMACRCQSDPYTWTVDDPFDGLVVCFGCRTCGTNWTRVAPDPMQKQHARIQERKAAADLVRLGAARGRGRRHRHGHCSRLPRLHKEGEATDDTDKARQERTVIDLNATRIPDDAGPRDALAYVLHAVREESYRWGMAADGYEYADAVIDYLWRQEMNPEVVGVMRKLLTHNETASTMEHPRHATTKILVALLGPNPNGDDDDRP